MDELVVPLALPGLAVDRDDALGVQVVAEPVAAVEIVRRRADGQVGGPGLLVDRDHRPDVRVAAVAPGTVLPGFDAEFILLGNGVKDPGQIAGRDVVGADEAGRRLLVGGEIGDDRADDHRVAADRRRRAVRGPALHHLAPEVGRHLDRAAVAEVRIGLAGGGVERHEPAVVGGNQHPLALAIGPVGDPAVLEAEVRGTAGTPALRVVGPDRLAAFGVDRGDLAERSGDEDPASDLERDRLELAPPYGARDLRVGGDRPPAPDDLDVPEVVAVDLVERRVLAVAGIAAEGRPVAGGAGLSRGGRARQSGGECQSRRGQRRNAVPGQDSRPISRAHTETLVQMPIDSAPTTLGQCPSVPSSANATRRRMVKLKSSPMTMICIFHQKNGL